MVSARGFGQGCGKVNAVDSSPTIPSDQASNQPENQGRGQPKYLALVGRECLHG